MFILQDSWHLFVKEKDYVEAFEMLIWRRVQGEVYLTEVKFESVESKRRKFIKAPCREGACILIIRLLTSYADW